MNKYIKDCQTPEELAEAIGDYLEHGGVHVHIVDERKDPIIERTERDHITNTKQCGLALRRYNEICRSYPNLPPPRIDTSDPLSGLAQLQGLCMEGQRGEPKGQVRPAETGRDVGPGKWRRRIECVKKVPAWTYALVVFLASLLTILYYLDWLEPIKVFFVRILR